MINNKRILPKTVFTLIPSPQQIWLHENKRHLLTENYYAKAPNDTFVRELSGDLLELLAITEPKSYLKPFTFALNLKTKDLVQNTLIFRMTIHIFKTQFNYEHQYPPQQYHQKLSPNLNQQSKMNCNQKSKETFP